MTEFKKALDDLNEDKQWRESITEEAEQTIIRALKIADKFMSEPNMTREQLLKEVDDE